MSKVNVKEYHEIPLTFDPMFKALLTAKESREYLATLIYYIVGIPKELVMKKAKIISGELYKEHHDEKGKETDLLIVVDNDIINIEMNTSKYYKEKNYAYMYKLSYGQYHESEDYKNSKRIIQINFDTEKTYDERTLIKFQMADIEKGIIDNENFIKYHINLDNVRIKYYNGSKQLSNLEKLLTILVINDKESLEKLKGKGEMMDNVISKAEKLKYSNLLNDLYEINEKHKIFEKQMIRDEAREEGLAEGLKEGRDKGIKEGIQEGIKKGIQEGIKKGINNRNIEIAKNLYKQNVDINIISSSTNLSIEEIQKLI